MKIKRPPLKEGVSASIPQIGLWDIETSKQLSESWPGMFEVNITNIVRYSQMVAWSVKKLDGSIVTRALCDYPLFKRDKYSDKALVTDLHNELSQYPILVAHNGDKFDVKFTNARFAYWGLTPVPPYKTIDTCKAARQYFNFPSNKLNELARFFGFKPKVDTGGMKLWDECAKGSQKAYAHMKKYNRYDVELLEMVYKRMRPYIKNHPNLTHFTNEIACRDCLSKNIIKRRTTTFKSKVADQMSCNNCGAWFYVNYRGKVTV